MRDRLVLLITGFITGVLIASVLPLPKAAAFFMLVLAGALLSLGRARIIAITTIPLVIVFVGVSLGVLRFHSADVPDALVSDVGREVSLSGEIVSDVDVRDTTQRIVLSTVTTETHTEPIKARVLIVADRYPEYRYGDELSVTGTLDKPEDFSIGNERYFDYDAYLLKDDILYEMYQPDIVKTGTGAGNIVHRGLFALKDSFIEVLNRLLPEPASALAAGELLGEKQALGEKLLNAFVITSVVHVVVLSGYNISIIAVAIERALSQLGGRKRLALSGALIVLFVIMTGAEAPSVRAAIMALVLLFARGTGRTTEATRLLFVAGGLMVAFNPHVLVFDPAFQLSFIATLGLVHFVPLIEPRLWFIPTKMMREIAAATVAAQLAVIPLLVYLSGELSLVSLPANLAVLFIIPYAMLFAFLLGVLGFILPALVLVPIAGIATVLLQYQVVVVEFFAALPHATVSLPPFSAWLLWGGYGAVLCVFWYIRYRRPEKHFL